MREVLYRGKRVDNGEWVEGKIQESDRDVYRCYIVTNSVIEPNGDDNGIDILEFNAVEVEPETVGQFTGLSDKNKVKIFEGDIVQMGGERYKVFLDEDNARFCLCRQDGNLQAGFNKSTMQICEVIGNGFDGGVSDG